MPEESPLVRQWILLRTLCARRYGATVREMAQEMGVSEKTRYVEESKWHETQELNRQKDGSVVAEFDLDHTEEIKRWILSFGKHAVVLGPEELRQDIAEEVGTMFAAYGDRRWKEDTLPQ